VEDEAIIALTCKIALQNYYRTNTVSTGMDAIDSVRETLADPKKPINHKTLVKTVNSIIQEL
jgi:hypothetical protein